MTTLNEILNFAIPITIILIFAGWVWLKTPLGAWLGPHLSNLWTRIKEGGTPAASAGATKREIVYE